ncbi:hypothetical protein J4231_03225 [Candidatus Woesearchaeota archaeon]|nr:hypothetical protein [Candidatus Woesearchaeota archaeon]
MAKCEVCREKIGETFLGKIRGTYINKRAVCAECQKKHTIQELKERLK